MYNYNRRGRGDSGDTKPYALAREIEDIEALIAEAGGSAHLRQLRSALAEDRRGDALRLFMRLAGSSDEDIAGARNTPMWPGLEALAYQLAYDAACLGDGRPPVDRLRTIGQPTLVVTGGGDAFYEQAADAIAASVPGARRRTAWGRATWSMPRRSPRYWSSSSPLRRSCAAAAARRRRAARASGGWTARVPAAWRRPGRTPRPDR